MSVADELGIASRHPGVIARAGQWVASTALGTTVLSRATPTLDALTLKITRGRTTWTESVGALPTIYLTTRGAKTGEPRTVPLVAVMSGGDVAVIGTNWGRTHHPAWVHNLLAYPHATITWRNRSLDVSTHEATGADADRIWTSARALHRGYMTYPTRTQGRTIRVFLLTKASDNGKVENGAEQA